MQQTPKTKILYACAAGHTHSTVKHHVDSKAFTQFVTLTKFSLSWAKFFIKLYNLVKEYPGLQQCSLSLHELQVNMWIICKFIKNKELLDFWKQLL